MAAMSKEGSLPSLATCSLALQLWRRVSKRFENSEFWLEAPREILAAEFLSLIRFALAPNRVEAALYEQNGKRGSPVLIASTLPQRIVPVGAADFGAPPPNLEFESKLFFLEGGVAAMRWLNSLPQGEWRELAKYHANYLARFTQKEEIPLGKKGNFRLHLFVDGAYNARRLTEFVQSLSLDRLIVDQSRTNVSYFQPKWDSLRQGLADYLLQDFLERLENDLAVLVDAETPDVWLLLTSADGVFLKFHTSGQKLARLRNHYQSEGASVKQGTVALLRNKVEHGESANAFSENLTACWRQTHELDWRDSSPLTVAHLECIAEKFEGWPVDRGIAATAVQTGCSEIVCDFTQDYRVKAYTAAAPPARFNRTRLAERVFITTKPNLIEIPLLWALDANGQGRCAALLLVLFKHTNDSQGSTDFFARRALSIRSIIEPWFMIMEHHGRMMEWTKVIHHHVIHETRIGVERLKKELNNSGIPALKNSSAISALDSQLRLLWEAYAFTKDNRGLIRTRVSVSEFAKFMRKAGSEATDGSQFKCVISLDKTLTSLDKAQIEVVPELFKYLAIEFLKESVATLKEIAQISSLNKDQRQIQIRMVYDDTKSRQIIVNIEHCATQGLITFVNKHRSALGKVPILSDDLQHAHLGMFYLGVLMQSSGGGLLEPKVEVAAKLPKITWSLSLPFKSAESGV
jgi:hypothetical protein